MERLTRNTLPTFIAPSLAPSNSLSYTLFSTQNEKEADIVATTGDGFLEESHDEERRRSETVDVTSTQQLGLQ